MSAGSILTLGYGPSGSASRVLTLGYGTGVVVEPPPPVVIPVSSSTVSPRRPPLEVFHAGTVRVSGGGRVRVLGHVASEGTPEAEVMAALLWALGQDDT